MSKISKDLPLDKEAIHVVWGKHPNKGNKLSEKEVKTSTNGWIVAHETKKTKYEDLIPVKPGSLIKAKKHMSNDIKPGDVVMFLHYEELQLTLNLKLNLVLDQNSNIADEEMAAIQKEIEKRNGELVKTMSYSVNAIIGEKTCKINVGPPEEFLDYFEPVNL